MLDLPPVGRCILGSKLKARGQLMLKIEHLTKTYGGKPAVQDLCLHIRPGELCAFIGHNGAGKTTTLKCCCGIQQFDAGEIYVDGISVRDDPLECKRRLAYLPDDPQLYEYMTGIQYLDFIADIFGVSAAQRVQRIRQYGDAFGLTQDLAQSIGAYSHGMKQKLAIIAALLHEPKLILMDEPFVGLDPLASHQLKTQMKAFCAQGGAIFTLADLAFAGASNAAGFRTVAFTSNISFIRPGTGRRLRAVATEVSRGRRTGVYSVQVFNDDGKVVAHGTTTGFISEEKL